MKLVFDIEANGFYEEADTIWCICAKELETGRTYQYDPKFLHQGLRLLEMADELIGHNIIDYDLRLLKKIYPGFKPKCLVLDTMILSQILNQERPGGHSLAAAGERYGRSKPEHEDWSQFSPEMLHRCSEDVEINTLLYDELMQEAYEDVRGLEYGRIFI